MTINIIQTTTKVLAEDRTLISTKTIETYELHPDFGKVLKNIKTGQVFAGFINIGTKKNTDDYIEIDKK